MRHWVTKALSGDSDVDLFVPRQRSGFRRPPWAVLAVVSAGGAIGTLARYLLGQAFPEAPAGFPWATFGINVSGCLLIGALMVLVTHVWAGRRLIRPFLGVGVLGGFTTFSTYVADIQRLADLGAAGTALVYMGGTVVAALVATYIGVTLTRWAIIRRPTKEAR